VILAASFFRYHEGKQTNKCTDGQINAAKTILMQLALVSVNYIWPKPTKP